MTEPYAQPDVLVSTAWVDQNRHRVDELRIVESDEDLLLYENGHIPEAVKIDWIDDLNDPVVRDYIDAERFAELCSRNGISNDTTVVFYGDKDNWWAAYALWVFKLLGHEKCVLMDGGRKKWIKEGRELVTAPLEFPSQPYEVLKSDPTIRAFQAEVLEHMRAGKPLIDVRSPQEFSGERTHMPEYPQEGVLRGGHIPGAQSVPWARAVREDGTFRTRAELEHIYQRDLGLSPVDDVVVYCRIGERSSHTWFVLRYLLGFAKVRNYDGSWTEWGNTVRAPIEKDIPVAVGR